MEPVIVYLRLQKKVVIDDATSLPLSALAKVITEDQLKGKLEQSRIKISLQEEEDYAVIGPIDILNVLSPLFPNTLFQFVDQTETIVYAQKEQKKKWYTYLLFLGLTVILFFGSALTIINFHDDVGMHAVQQKIYFIITGEQVNRPLLLQIPYAFGLAIGMFMFVNRWFSFRLNNEPSPIEMEIFQYEQTVREYISYDEKKQDE